jgi:truncated hemoglobin YjbI
VAKNPAIWQQCFTPWCTTMTMTMTMILTEKKRRKAIFQRIGQTSFTDDDKIFQFFIGNRKKNIST